MSMTDEEIQGLIEAYSVAWAVEFQKGNKEEARFFSDTATALRQLRDEVKAMALLVSHCWVHSGYEECGRLQMTTEQKRLFDAITSDEGPADRRADG